MPAADLVSASRRNAPRQQQDNHSPTGRQERSHKDADAFINEIRTVSCFEGERSNKKTHRESDTTEHRQAIEMQPSHAIG